MSKIGEAFANGKAFIAFVTCGDPDLETTMSCVRAAVENGADLIELGIPFSDPTAEGPVIQGANLRALTYGVTTDKIFEMVKKLRQDVTVPMVFMTYANVIFSYGAERFLSACREIGIDGLILPDLPYEEKEEFLDSCHSYGVDLISLIAPTSANRIAMIAKEAEGFLYVVSSLGVNKHEKRDQDGFDIHRGGDTAEYGYSLRHWLRYFHAGTGTEDGRSFGRSDRGLSDCEDYREARQGGGALRRSIRAGDERRNGFHLE